MSASNEIMPSMQKTRVRVESDKSADSFLNPHHHKATPSMVGVSNFKEQYER